MKKLISIILGTVFFSNVYAQEFSDDFNKTFTTTKDITLFCGEPKDVAYYMGYSFQLVPVSIGTGWNIMEQEYNTTILATSQDLTNIAILTMHEGKLCVSNISVKHKLYKGSE